MNFVTASPLSATPASISTSSLPAFACNSAPTIFLIGWPVVWGLAPWLKTSTTSISTPTRSIAPAPSCFAWWTVKGESMSTMQIPAKVPLDDYSSVIGEGEVAELRTLAKPLAGRSVVMINSTAVGGGVAEILNRLVPLAEELGINIRWEVMTGGEDFFEVTKAFHNALHGEPYRAESKDFDVYRSYNEQNQKRIPLDAEFVVIHDPQPAGLIQGRRGGRNHWVWRCHIDLSHPNSGVWDFLREYVANYDGA